MEVVPERQHVTRRPDRGVDQKVLGITFYGGVMSGSVDRMLRHGGLLVVPAAPALVTMTHDAEYRRALLHADMVIPDSSYMVMIWNALEKKKLMRLSGLAYLRELLSRPEVRAPGELFWIMASPASAEKNLALLRSQGLEPPASHLYLAPMYPREGQLVDETLLRSLEEQKPAQIIVTLGGGTQERLGLYLRENLSYKPGIHCIGAAIAFLSGDQVAIPVWADRMYLGWLFRTLHEPRRYFPRYWAAFSLAGLIFRYRDKLPPMAA